jgi:uncharacterized protein YcbK (DUF882 family)
MKGKRTIMERSSDHFLYPLVREPKSRWERSGLTPAQERHFVAALWLLVFVFAAGWIYTIALAVIAGERTHMVARVTSNPLSTTAPPEAAFALDAVMRQFLPPVEDGVGARVVVVEPGEDLPIDVQLPEGAELEFTPVPGTSADTTTFRGAPPEQAGIWNVAIRMRDAVRQVPDLNVITQVPLTEARGGRLRGYRIGEWAMPRGLSPQQQRAYAIPRGMIEVTPENMNLQVSEHFRLRDFLTKGQDNVWPKYVLMSPRVLDKLELTIQELERMGHRVENVGVISGFRHPFYNLHGGDPRGRGALSRHMYGDAMDWYVDNTRNGCMDDLNGDGRVDIRDAQIIAAAAERVERQHPHLIGGIGIYRPNPGAHCGFVHLDTRGWRARW